MFKKILFATTASPTCDAAARVAFNLSARFDSRLTLFHVYGYPSHGYSPFAVDARTGEEVPVDPDYKAWVEEEMKNTYAKYLGENPDTVIHTTVGQPFTEILKIARKNDVDLIIMGAHSQEEDVGTMRFRSTAGNNMQKVVKSARCPVLIVNRPCISCFEPFSTIVFGTDLSSSAYYAFLAAFKMAKTIGAELSIFHALSIKKDDLGLSPNQEDIEEQLVHVRKKIEDIYVPKLEGYEKYKIGVWEGVPYVEILKYAREEKANLIVMAHHTRETEPENALMGSTAEQVVLRSACPVVIVNRPAKSEK